MFTLDNVEAIVIDEADRMYDLGFIRDIRYVMRRLPPRDKRLSMLFSATLGYLVLELATQHLNEPEIVRIEPDKKVVDEVEQWLYYPSSEEKAPLLAALLAREEVERSMVFVNTRREADQLSRWLEEWAGARRRFPATCRRTSACACSSAFTTATCRCWWPPTWLRAACMCRT